MPNDDNPTPEPTERPPRRGGRQKAGSRHANFAANLKYLRERAGKTQDQLNGDLNLPAGTIPKWEQRTWEPTLSQLETVADYFDVTTYDLLSAKPGFAQPDPPSAAWQRFVLDLLAQYPSRVEIKEINNFFWAGNQTAHLHPPRQAEET
jgi:transcriptional regulator with XRE-family HTH domain